MAEPGPKFIVDDMAGRLARWLRIAGFDTFYRKSISDGELIGRALKEGRIILTRDSRLTANRTLPRHLFLRSQSLDEQLTQVFSELGLALNLSRAFTRCSRCNLWLEPAPKSLVQPHVPPYVFQRQQTFFRCPSCRKIFWQGSHWERVVQRLQAAAGTEINQAGKR